jgi:hypothetical protein
MKQNIKNQCIEHGNNLKRIFALKADTDPILLCKRLRRIESALSKIYAARCDDSGTSELAELNQEKRTVERLKGIFPIVEESYNGCNITAIDGDNTRVIPIIFNSDPRGYALKIDDAYMTELIKKGFNLHLDWGSYGIIAPEFSDVVADNE